jgi:hypothetical protein
VNEPASHSTFSPIIAFDSSGNPWGVWQGEYPNTIYFSQWNGEIWNPEGTVIPEDTLIDSRPWIVANYNGEPWIVWSRTTGDGVNGPDIMFSRWNGTGWDSMQTVSHAVRNDYAPMLATGGGELWVVWYEDTTGGPNPVDYNTFASRWNGLSWDPEMLVSHPDTIGHYWYQEFECALDVDDCGHPHVVWHTYADGCVFYRAFYGDSWGDFVPIVDTSDEIWGDFVQIALDDSGNRHVVFVGPGPTLSSTDIYYSMSSDGENWIPPYQIHVDDTIDDIPQIACTSPDDVWVTWYREISLWNTHVCISHFDGYAWSEPLILDNDSTEADQVPNVALDSLGNPMGYLGWNMG